MNVIDYKDVEQQPNRESFIQPIVIGETFHFHPITIVESLPWEKYIITLFGILKNGAKVAVEIEGIRPYFEVIVENEEEAVDVSRMIPCKSYEIFYAKQFKGYQEKKNTFVRLFFDSLKPRKEGIETVRENGYSTTTDDKSRYYSIVCRDAMTTFSSWVTIDHYTTTNTKYKIPLYTTCLENYKPVDPVIIQNDSELKRDLTVVCSFDIETWSRSGGLPDHQCENDRMFCVALSFQFLHDMKPFYAVVLCEFPADAEPKAVLEDDIETDDECSDRGIETDLIGETVKFEGGDEQIYENFTEVELEEALYDVTDFNSTGAYTTVVCKTEERILLAMSIILEKMKPDIIMGFNDCAYDWPWVINRSKQYDILETFATRIDMRKSPKFCYSGRTATQNILTGYCRTREIKIDAMTKIQSETMQMLGYITIDVRVALRRLQNEEQSSLKFFLNKFKLPGKADMPYEQMFRIITTYINFLVANYELVNKVIGKNAFTARMIDKIRHVAIKPLDAMTRKELKLLYATLKNDLAAINAYCYIDAIRCHQLALKTSFITDSRQVANMAYMAFADAIFLANGVKVRNLSIAVGQRAPYNIRFSSVVTHQIEKGKYPGAQVYDPKKDFYTSKLSMMEHFKKGSPRWVDVSLEEINNLQDFLFEVGAWPTTEQIDSYEQKRGKRVPQVFREFVVEESKYPVTGLDFASLYPSLMRCYNISTDMIIRDGNQALDLHKRGVPMTPVEFDYNGRRCKATFVKHENIYDTSNPNYKFGLYPYILDGLFRERKAIKKELKIIDEKLEHIALIEQKPASEWSEKENALLLQRDELMFNRNYIDSKQKALKVFMNTFYGETGNKVSPFFILEVAGSVTATGQRSIKFAHAFVIKLGHKVVYGDTDSLYIELNKELFAEADRLYYSARITKLAYWTMLVEISMKEMKNVQTLVNNHFRADNKTEFLTMAYEEVLFPMLLLAKKKYCGIPHENLVNFQPKKLFIKGLELVKRGNSALLRDTNMEILWKAFAVDNVFTVNELVHMQIDRIYAMEHSFETFVQTGVLRPEKNNVSMKRFRDRVEARGDVFAPYERHNYVIVETYPWHYDERARKGDIKKGDRMELVAYAKEHNLRIDLDYYMKGNIIGSFARLITYERQFTFEPVSNNAADIKSAENAAYKSAVRYLTEYTSRYFTNYAEYGTHLKKIHSVINKKTAQTISNPIMSKLLADDLSDNIISGISHVVDKIATTVVKKDYATRYLDRCAYYFFNNLNSDIIEISEEEFDYAPAKKTKKLKPVTITPAQRKMFYRIMQKRTYAGCTQRCTAERPCKKSNYCAARWRLRQREEQIIKQLEENKTHGIDIYSAYRKFVNDQVKHVQSAIFPSDINEPARGTQKILDIEIDDAAVLEQYQIKEIPDFNEVIYVSTFYPVYTAMLAIKIAIRKMAAIEEKLKTLRNAALNVNYKIVQPPITSGSLLFKDIQL